MSEPSVIDMEAGVYSYTVADKLIMEAEEKPNKRLRKLRRSRKRKRRKDWKNSRINWKKRRKSWRKRAIEIKRPSAHRVARFTFSLIVL